MIAINPGSGPVAGGQEKWAVANIPQLLADAGHPDAAVERLPREDADGRFGFALRKAGVTHVVEMPGLPLEQVRYLGAEGQNIWHFPRLYVDGNSWVWKYAVDKLHFQASEAEAKAEDGAALTRIYGPEVCPQPCAECPDARHHYLAWYVDEDDAGDVEEFLEEHPGFDLAQLDAGAYYGCLHCPAVARIQDADEPAPGADGC